MTGDNLSSAGRVLVAMVRADGDKRDLCTIPVVDDVLELLVSIAGGAS